MPRYSFFDASFPTFRFYSGGVLLGTGCALNYHTGVQMLNLVVGSKKNATRNGISLAGNTFGAIAVFYLMGNAFKTLHYAQSLFYLSIGMSGILIIFTLAYLIPQRYIDRYHVEDDKEDAGKVNEKWYETMFDKDVAKTASYYLLILSQCLNAIGFLNLTTFLNVHLNVQMGYDNVQTAVVLTVMQVCDCIGRLVIPRIADKLTQYCPYTIHIIYMIGTLGNGACMLALEDINTELGIYVICALMGLFAR